MPHRSFLEIALRGDRAAARALTQTLRNGGYTPDRLALEVITPALVEVGNRWMRNELSVADEHLVSSIAERTLVEISLDIPQPAQSAPMVLMASVSSEAHRIGQQILEILFLQAGFRVQVLGSNVPALDLLATVRRLSPQVIGLSVTMSYHVNEARETLALLRSVTSVPLLVGGAVFKEFPELGAGLDADWIGADATEAVRFAARQTLTSPTP